ncbi:MAG: dnaQ, partial [Alphaproteobacteria bacterium]|nr:dnaQ [Alphaproteobacteria bacterium]
GRVFHAYFNPGRPMPMEAAAIHGLSDAFLADKPRFQDRCEELLEFIADSPLIAHNASFDFGFLNHELGACGRALVCLTRMIDTLVIARQRHPGAKHSLDALCTRFGIDRSLRVKHGALIDAQLLAQCYIELTGGRQIGLSLAAETLNSAADRAEERRSGSAPIIVQVRPPRPHAPSEEELVRHAAFVTTLVDPIWNRLAAGR